MESSDFLRALIQSKQGQKFKTLSELAEKSGVNQGNLSSFMKPEGDPRRRENITFDSAWKILKFLGVSFSEGSQHKPELATDEQIEALKWEKAGLLGQVNLLKEQLQDAHAQIRELERGRENAPAIDYGDKKKDTQVA